MTNCPLCDRTIETRGDAASVLNQIKGGEP